MPIKKYLIDKKVLQARNNVIIDQPAFGNPVESEAAGNFPVKLAAALLRDNSGRTKLHLPVSGEMDDPDFRIEDFIAHRHHRKGGLFTVHPAGIALPGR